MAHSAYIASECRGEPRHVRPAAGARGRGPLLATAGSRPVGSSSALRRLSGRLDTFPHQIQSLVPPRDQAVKASNPLGGSMDRAWRRSMTSQLAGPIEPLHVVLVSPTVTYLSLQERRGGAGFYERACRPLCGPGPSWCWILRRQEFSSTAKDTNPALGDFLEPIV